MRNRYRKLFAIIFIALPATSCAVSRHTLAGRVFDCRSQQPVAGARVEIHQTDWGMREGSPVWDKDFVYSATTDGSGKFVVEYRHGSDAKILVKKTGYMTTQHFSVPSRDVAMGLLEGKEIDYCEKCRPLTNCLQTTTEKGVQVTRDVCED